MNFRVEESDIPTNLRIDLNNAINNSGDNFGCKLMQLIFKADSTNLEKLYEVYPEEVDVVRRYKRGEIKPPKSNPGKDLKINRPHLVIHQVNTNPAYGDLGTIP